MQTPRNYQDEILLDIDRAFEGGHQRVLCALPTAAGKTVIALNAIDRHLQAGGIRAYFLADRKTIVRQTVLAFGEYEHAVSVVWAGRGEDPEISTYEDDPTYPVQVCSIDTMQRRDEWRADVGREGVLFVCDEGHGKTVWGQLGQEIQQNLGQSRCLILSASPDRLDPGESFLDLPGGCAIVQGPEYPYDVLEASGWLVPAEYHQMRAVIDVGGVQTVAGDFEQRALARAANQERLILGALELWEARELGRRTVAFCVDVDHAKAVVGVWRSAGHYAEVVVGETDNEDRARIFSSFERGETSLLATCGALTYGWNCPPVEVGLLMRPTQSWMLYWQMIGRLLRISPSTGKGRARIYDQTLNVSNFGVVQDLQRYKLRAAKEKRDVCGGPRTKVCPSCSALCSLRAESCPACGASLVGEGAKTVPWVDFRGYVAERIGRKVLDLEVGQQFGMLTVIGPGDKDKKGKRTYRVRCSCSQSTIKDVGASTLISGDTVSCGCKRAGIRLEIGQKFGMLKVIGPGDKGRNTYRVSCSCPEGTIKNNIPASRLVSGHITSCGCKGMGIKLEIGQKFGMLTVIGPGDKDSRGDYTWRVKCSCPEGTIKDIPTNKLVSGNIASCGCARVIKLEVGQKFGMLTVIGPGDIGKRGGLTYQVRCACGTIKNVAASALSSGNTTSCGCKKEGIKLEIGQQFGMLRVIGPGGRDKYGNKLWRVKCSCHEGTIKDISASKLVSGDTTTCGCSSARLHWETRRKKQNQSPASSSSPLV